MQLTPTYSTYRSAVVKIPKVIMTNDEIAEAICKIVSEHTHIPVLQIKGNRRFTEYVNARKIAQYLIYNYTTFGLKKVGIIFGGQHWSTVIHAKAKLLDLIETEPIYRQTFELCEKSVALRFKKCVRRD